MKLVMIRQMSEDKEKYEQLEAKLKQMRKDFSAQSLVHQLHDKCAQLETELKKILTFAPRNELHQLNQKYGQLETELKAVQKIFNIAPRYYTHHQLDERCEQLETELNAVQKKEPMITYCAPRDVLHHL